MARQMHRRSFLRTLTSLPFDQHPALHKALTPQPLNLTTGLEPYQPNSKLSAEDARHLLRRTCFAPTPAELETATKMTPAEAVEHLLRPLPSPPIPEWYDTDPLSPSELRRLTEEERRAYRQQQFQQIFELIRWWYDLMIAADFSLREKMVFFFHNHFTSGFVQVKVPHYMLTQNMLFREYAFGNLKELTEKIVYDPAMLVYLNGNVNTLRRPNENFGRELLELFTMGEGNYTEWDIVEVSRVCTGWFNTFHKPYYDFDPFPKNPRLRRHDYLSKSIFGEIIDPQVNDDMSTAEIRERGMAEVPQLIDLIFRQQFDESRGYDPSHPYYGKSIAAVFFAAKLYRTFVYEIVDPTIVAALADLLVENNFQLKPVLKTLLQSAHFFDPQLRGAQIKSPLDFTVGLLRMYPFVELYRNNQRTWNSILRSVTSVNTILGLRLLQPPDVSGWPGHRDWLNTFTYPYRNAVSDLAIQTLLQQSPTVLYQFAQQFPSFQTNVRTFVSEATSYLLAFPPLESEFDNLVETLLDGAPEYEWSDIAQNAQTVIPRLRAFFQATMKLPQFQLT